VIAEHLAVVGPEDHDGLFESARAFERPQQAPDGVVDRLHQA